MKKILVIPDIENIEKSLSLANEYNLGFEYNDFFTSDVLDDELKKKEIIKKYKSQKLPDYTTNHGAFIDVLPFSADKKIKEVAYIRIKQSIDVSKGIGAKAVVFHLNYNPLLKVESYVNDFVKKNVDIWQRILNENPGISIYIENMFEQNPIVLKSVAKDLCKNDNFGICLDWAHATLSGVSPELWAEELKDYVKHIHINDNDLNSDGHLPWGGGNLDRNLFYSCYDRFLSDSTILIETTNIDEQLKSLRQLEKDGFIK
ncbi:MAG: sugar phosphate isomerase/epimerase [Clostridia bacterium]|nr:sugar phosphate isomerase/epimerase [Clostridia bacterium]